MVERQRLYIGSMRASRFWRIRDDVFGLLRRFGVREDPLPVPTIEDVRTDSVAFGDPYQLFRAKHRKRPDEYEMMRSLVRHMAVNDSFDIVVDARGTTGTACDATLASLREQAYPHWRALVLSGDLKIEPRTGKFLIGLEAGDVLEPDALVSLFVRFAEGADVVYTDQDTFDADGIPSAPYFKPDWSPETILTRDYVGRVCAFRTDVLERCGGVDIEAAPAAWYDALLRASEVTNRIVHVTKVLVHTVAGPSVYDSQSALIAVRAALDRRGEHANVTPMTIGIDVRFEVPGTERVSVIVPTRDRADLLGRCLASVFEKTTYRDIEIIVVDNGSRDERTAALLQDWLEREPERFRVLRDDGTFNFSRLNNTAVRASTGSFIVLLNNDTEVIAHDWVGAMLGQARRPPIGAVGALLLFEDGTIQHAGIVLGGVLGLAGHAFRFKTVEVSNGHGALDFDTNYLAVTGACLMLSRAKFDEVGGLDESFAVAYNDVDLCVKLHNAGYRNVLVPGAQLYHHESKTRGADDTAIKLQRGLRESEAFRQRWPQWAAYDPYYNPNLTLTAEDFSLRL